MVPKLEASILNFLLVDSANVVDNVYLNPGNVLLLFLTPSLPYISEGYMPWKIRLI